MNVRVFFDTDPRFNCTRVEWPAKSNVFSDLPPTAVNVQVVDHTLIPTDRTFRNALKPDLMHDMTKCREIWRERLRILRLPKIAALDAAYLRADETGDVAEKQRIAAQKQALRDVTADPRIDTAQTPDELKFITVP